MVSLRALTALLISHCASAVRNARKGANTGAGRIAYLYSFGSPHVSAPALTGAGGSCLPGYRILLFRNNGGGQRDSEDIVPKLLGLFSYKHPNVETLAIWNNTDRDALKAKWPCGDNPRRSTQSDINLHSEKALVAALGRLDSSYSRAQVAGRIGVLNSFDDNADSVKERLAGSGWNLVGSAVAGEDVTHLIQERSSMRCIITFEGADTADDWGGNLQTGKVSFCGLSQRVHKGFKGELLAMVTSSEYRAKIWPKLGKCSAVDAVGHSLGGAQATLFTGCINNAIPSADYDSMSWESSTPVLMASI